VKKRDWFLHGAPDVCRLELKAVSRVGRQSLRQEHDGKAGSHTEKPSQPGYPVKKRKEKKRKEKEHKHICRAPYKQMHLGWCSVFYRPCSMFPVACSRPRAGWQVLRRGLVRSNDVGAGKQRPSVCLPDTGTHDERRKDRTACAGQARQAPAAEKRPGLECRDRRGRVVQEPSSSRFCHRTQPFEIPCAAQAASTREAWTLHSRPIYGHDKADVV